MGINNPQKVANFRSQGGEYAARDQRNTGFRGLTVEKQVRKLLSNVKRGGAQTQKDIMKEEREN